MKRREIDIGKLPDREKLPGNSTWYVMSKYQTLLQEKLEFLWLKRVEYGLKQSKNELGWADYRFTRYCDIERWWEIVCSAYLMVSLHAECTHIHQILNKIRFSSQVG